MCSDVALMLINITFLVVLDLKFLKTSPPCIDFRGKCQFLCNSAFESLERIYFLKSKISTIFQGFSIAYCKTNIFFSFFKIKKRNNTDIRCCIASVESTMSNKVL